MTEKELRQYRSILKEIDDLDSRIDQLYSREIEAISGKVKGSSKYFPYTEVRTSVLMNNPTEIAARDRLIVTRKAKREQLQQTLLEIETFVNEIEDSELRLTFKYIFIDGMRQREVAKILNVERSTVSKRVKTYLNIHTNHKNSVI
jgi:DNA-directed RNA polymerase specialized sigma subunit